MRPSSACRARATSRSSPTTTVPSRATPMPFFGELNDRGATATFFVLLTRVRRSPGHITEMLAAGHEVALHGGRPPSPHRAGPRRPQRTRDGRTRSELEDLAGVPVKWFRPPYGSQNGPTWQAVRLRRASHPCSGPSTATTGAPSRSTSTSRPVRQPSSAGRDRPDARRVRRRVRRRRRRPASRAWTRPQLTRSVLDEAELRGLSARSVCADALETAAPAWQHLARRARVRRRTDRVSAAR